MTRKHTTEEFVARARQRHGDRYDYSQSDYVSQSTPIKVICPEHGAFFPTPKKHVLSGTGCPVCARRSASLEKFIAAARAVHGDKYSYDLVRVTTTHAPVTIVCPTHGPFEQGYKVHLLGHGCAKCAGVAKKNRDEFVAEASIVHDGAYDYSKVEYVSAKSPVTITCKKHGDFQQSPSSHLRGSGCPACGRESSRKIHDEWGKQRLDQIVARGLPYSYDFPETMRAASIVNVTCDKGHKFSQRADGATRYGCPVCAGRNSTGEREVRSFIEGLGVKTERTRGIANGKEIDIWCPDYRIGFEFNGLYWHSDAFPDARLRHYEKSKSVASSGGKLVHIWSDDWRQRRSAVEHMILAKLGKLPSIGARECQVLPVPKEQAKAFLEQFHLQGWTPAEYTGLWSHGQLVACIGMSKAKSARGKPEEGVYELVRYCANHRVAGGGSKLLKDWKSRIGQWKKIVTYCDLAQFDGRMYELIGFTAAKQYGPDYKVLRAGIDVRMHKSSVQKSRLKIMLGDKFDQSKTESQLCSENHIFRVWDCGKIRYEMNQ
jgi:hypothetical protein